MKIFFLILGLLFSAGSAAAEGGKTYWRWYYSAFESPEQAAGVFLRSGQALVERKKGGLKINFREKNSPELSHDFSGDLINKNIKGVLKNFFMHNEDLLFSGEYHSKTFGKQCFLEQIFLRSAIPDGSMLVLSRVRGSCQ